MRIFKINVILEIRRILKLVSIHTYKHLIKIRFRQQILHTFNILVVTQVQQEISCFLYLDQSLTSNEQKIGSVQHIGVVYLS